MNTIDEFSGEYRFLSNFFPSPVTYEGIEFPTVEHAFQAAKTMDTVERIRIAELKKPGEAKRAGRKVALRPDWENVKEKIMLDILRLKFAYPDLRKYLLNTGEVKLEEGNTWGDRYWGTCFGIGRNRLGHLLMKLRKELQ